MRRKAWIPKLFGLLKLPTTRFKFQNQNTQQRKQHLITFCVRNSPSYRTSLILKVPTFPTPGTTLPTCGLTTAQTPMDGPELCLKSCKATGTNRAGRRDTTPILSRQNLRMPNTKGAGNLKYEKTTRMICHLPKRRNLPTLPAETQNQSRLFVSPTHPSAKIGPSNFLNALYVTQ